MSSNQLKEQVVESFISAVRKQMMLSEHDSESNEVFSGKTSFTEGIYLDIYFNSKKHPELLKFAEEYFGEGDLFLEVPVNGCDCEITDVYLEHEFNPNEDYFDLSGQYRDFGFYYDYSKAPDKNFTQMLTKQDLKKIEDVLNTKVYNITFDERDPHIEMEEDCEVFLD